MAASYSTGSASSPTDLLQKLVTWLVTQGWTQDMSQAEGSGWRAHLHKSGQYVNLRAASGEYGIWTYRADSSSYPGSGIGLYLGDGFDSGLAWNAQSGGPKYIGTTNTVGVGLHLLGTGGIAAYHFFDDGLDHVDVVVERTAGNCAHMGWGPSLVKTGYTSDCWYFYGSSPSYANLYYNLDYPGNNSTAAAPTGAALYSGDPLGLFANAYVRVDESVYSARWVGFAYSSSYGYFGHTGRRGLSALYAASSSYLSTFGLTEIPAIGVMQDRGWQSAFVGALLLPLQCFVQAITARWIPVGHPPTVFYCAAVGHGFASGEVYQVGGLDYMLFPGFAVRKAA